MKLGWIDYSKEERNKIVYILRNLKNQSAVDELGIGTIRDAFSDILFPGISTLHTRAKYYVLIPYLFQKAESVNFKKQSDVRSWIESKEDALVKTLIRNSDKSTSGIIGARIQQSGGSVKYKPSGTYWNAFRSWGILKISDLSLDDACALTYAKSKKRNDIKLKQETENESADDIDNLRGSSVLFEPIMFKEEYLEEASITLLKHEADFLFNQITTFSKTKDSLLSFMLREHYLPESFEKIDSSKLPSDIEKVVKLAQDFSNFIFGAHLLFNVIYSEGSDEVIAHDFEKWFEEKHLVDLEEVIKISHCSPGTRDFLNKFKKHIDEHNIDAAKKLLIQREKQIKGDRSKLSNIEKNKYKVPIHAYKLYYRYPTVFTILSDIQIGLDNHG